MGDVVIIGRPAKLTTDWTAFRNANKIREVDTFEDYSFVPDGDAPCEDEPVFVRD